MSDIFGQVCGLALLLLCLLLILKNQNAAMAPLLRVGGIVLVSGLLLSRAMPLIQALWGLAETEAGGMNAGTLLKGLGLALLCELCAGICRENGESGLAGFVEAAAKTELLLLALPMMEEVFNLSRSLLEMSG